jgi:hypothetical protein
VGVIGDSLSSIDNAWRKMLMEHLNLNRSQVSFQAELPENLAWSGRSAAQLKSSIDGWLAVHTYDAARDYLFLINIGANDIESDGSPPPVEVTWKADVQYIIDAVLVKFPGCKMILSKPSEATGDNNSAIVGGYIDDLIAANPGVCYEGDNELVWKKSTDNYATQTIDGQHYGTVGQVTKESVIYPIVITVLGY